MKGEKRERKTFFRKLGGLRRTVFVRGRAHRVYKRFGLTSYVLPTDKIRGYFAKAPWWSSGDRKRMEIVRERGESLAPETDDASSPPPSLPSIYDSHSSPTSEWCDDEDEISGLDRSGHASHTYMDYKCLYCILRSAIQTLWRRGDVEEHNAPCPTLLDLARRQARDLLAQIDRKYVTNYIRSMSLSEEMVRTLVSDQLSVV